MSNTGRDAEPPIEVTVIGVGSIGSSHARAVRDHPSLSLASVVDVDAERARQVATEFDAGRALVDPEDALDDADAAVIATPEDHHVEGARAALDRGVHLLLEKPIAVDLDAARSLADRAETVDAVTGTGFLLRYDPAHAKAEAAIRSGTLGEVVSLRAKRAIKRSDSERAANRADGGHPLFYMNAHDVDLLLWCAGSRVTNVVGVERRGVLDEHGVPDATQALLSFESGATGVLEGYGLRAEDAPSSVESELDVVGTDGTAAVRTPGDALAVQLAGYDRPDTRLGPVVHGRLDGALYRQMDRFARAIRGECDGMSADLRDGARAHAVADAIRRAIADGERVSVST